MRHEVVKLTDGAIYPELIKLLFENGDVWGDMLTEYKHNFKILFQNGGWTRAYPQYKADYTISDVDFLQKYGENTEPEAAPAWSFKTDDDLADLIGRYEREKYAMSIFDFLSSIRKPAFELICQDGVVTDPEQIVWTLTITKKAKDVKDEPSFITHAAAINHRLHNTPAIKLSDMKDEPNYYWIAKEDAHNLVNERIKSTPTEGNEI